ncbi:short-chain dehydrogenase [Superficieibacter electus]|uniref:Short-chain dehydrogenase n=1 Tax=Superficieibacter electus TaxID=2022662 RepID=A0A2P5GNV4_9ENTR|nr:SDR family NAD(P)-dependent oxidoreductase [Superficieibacter electus]POP44032.1 short-chain dehydrogenase [Superficieibacter electus]POP48204.1 short-chain dehydrogenase [Superficieibacter electus]
MAAQRIALVTGANKGIGLEIARQLMQAGVQVIIGARDNARGQGALDTLRAEGRVDAIQLDITDVSSITAAAEHIRQKYGRLDILVNNAGIFDSADAPPATASLDAVRRVMETNFIGTLAITQAMLPLIRLAEKGRIVNLSSSLGSLTLNGDPDSPYYSAQYIGYNASKAALNMLTVQLAEELKESGIVVTSVSPGFVKSDLNNHTGVISTQEGARLPVHYALQSEKSGLFVEPPDTITPW